MTMTGGRLGGSMTGVRIDPSATSFVAPALTVPVKIVAPLHASALIVGVAS